jgi:hypothetical protein
MGFVSGREYQGEYQGMSRGASYQGTPSELALSLSKGVPQALSDECAFRRWTDRFISLPSPVKLDRENVKHAKQFPTQQKDRKQCHHHRQQLSKRKAAAVGLEAPGGQA